MDSPQPSLTTSAIPIPSSSSPSLSPTVQESPLFNYLQNLSPIKSVKTSKYAQRFSRTSYHVPPPVFTSPRIDLCRRRGGGGGESSFNIKRVENDAACSDGGGGGGGGEVRIQFNNELIYNFQKDDQPCSPPGCIDQYLADDTPANLEAADGQDKKVIETSFPQPLQIVEPCKDSARSSRQTQRGFVKEVDQQQRGIRRHLQFGVSMGSKDTGNGTSDAANASLPDKHHAEPNGISSNCQSGDRPRTGTFLSSFCPSQSVRSAQNYEHDIPACFPSGLGLPASGNPMGNLTARKKLAGNLHEQEEKQLSDRNRSPAKELLDIISITSFSREIYVHVQNDQQESQAARTVGSATYPNTVQPPCDFLSVTPYEQQIVPYEGRTFTSAHNDIDGELNQVSPKQNRKKAKHMNNSEGCKRCTCKRSKCLKLYCECFAAGVYCLDSCACESCFNKPEYEDTVLDTRQKIEARNPLAFAPKVVKQASNSPADMEEERNWTTPSSARHKRGCNCKKSKCLKKYCECYQAGVGCSGGCRCEGCKNSHGKKAESMYRTAQKWKNLSQEPLDTLDAQDNFIKVGRAHQFTSTREEFLDITPLSQRQPGLMATSGSLGIGDSSKVSQSQADQRSSLQSSAGYLHSPHSANSLTPKFLFGSKVMPELSPETLVCNMLKEDDTPQMLNNTSTPTKTVKAGSPNQKRVSLPQILLEESSTSSSKGLKSGRKFNLPDVPSFPPLTPYSKSKDGVQQFDGD